MTPLRLLLSAAILAAATPARTESPAAYLLPAKSEIAFVGKQLGVPVEGRFGRFKAQVAFDPSQPEGGSVALSIDTDSASLGVPQVDAELSKPLWFDSGRYPQAGFKSSSIRALGGGRFELAGRLTIKGAAQDLVVPMTLTQAYGESVASGSFTVKRLAFKIGDGEWADTAIVGNDVQVRFKLTMTGLRPL